MVSRLRTVDLAASISRILLELSDEGLNASVADATRKAVSIMLPIVARCIMDIPLRTARADMLTTD